MQYKITLNEKGDHYNSEKERCFVNECNVAHTPEGLNVGYTSFDTYEEMCETWKVVRIPEKDLLPPKELEEEQPSEVE